MATTVAELTGKPEVKAEKAGKPKGKLFVMTLKDKGGTGASMLARKLAEEYEARGMGAYLVDGDGTTASLYSHFGAGSNPVHAFSLHGSLADRDSIARLLEVNARIVLLDLPATSLTVLRKIEKDYSWTTMLGEYGWRPVIVSSISPGKQSVFNLGDVIDMFEDRADYVVGVNLGLGSGHADRRDRDFRRWVSSATRHRFGELGGVEFDFPMLDKGIMAEIEDAGVTFARGRTLESLDMVDRMYLAKWVADADRAFQPARKLLGL
jgi:hypothetical protein